LGNKTNPMKSLNIIMLPVHDRQKAKAFYLTLGFQIVIEAKDPHGKDWIQMKLPNGDTTISLSDFQGLICETADIISERAQLKSQGVDVGDIEKTPWGKFAWFKDLDGNSLCLMQK